MTLKTGDFLPELSVIATPDRVLRASDLLGKYTVLYFYPKDNTPGCTQQGLDFSAHFDEIQSLNAQVFGVSLDSLKKHQNFIAKQGFKFDLIADIDSTLCELFEVIKLKKNFGKEYMGIERSTFILSPTGQLLYEWRKVSVKGHITDVINTLKTLQ